jgi:predicted acyltransferase
VERLGSLDAFRGFAIASMLLVNNPGDWNHVYAPLAHAEWSGWTFTDMVFPFFLLAVGVSMALSVDRHARAGANPRELMRKLAGRAVVIFLVGLALNAFPAFDLSTLRIPGVLQRIALCIVIAAPIAVYGSIRDVTLAIALLLAVYTIPMATIGTLEPGRDFGAGLDRAVFGSHLWARSKTWDPEGLWSTLPAACSLLFGVLTGRYLLAGAATVRSMLFAGAVALAAGFLLDFLMPINKNLWTPSYAIFMTGWSLVVFAAFHALPAQPKFLVIFGMNALFIFALSGFIARLIAPVKAQLHAPLQSLPIAPVNASLAFAILFTLAMFAVAWAMWKKQWFVKV